MNKGEGWRLPAAKDIHFDIDDHVNRFIPPSQLHRFPKLVARFLGYRKTPASEVGNIVVALWSLLGAFCGLAVVTAAFKFSHIIQSYHPPILFASLGATAILDYNTIQSPLAQPRAAILGHGFAAIVGVSIAKLFMLSNNYMNLKWIAGPLSCGVASFVMGMTNTVHPPGGATAVLAAIDPTIIAMGWMFIPMLLLGSALMLGVALLLNNIQRQFPVFWWTPRDVGVQKRPDIESLSVNEKQPKEPSEYSGRASFKNIITLAPERILVPEGFVLGSEEVQVLEVLRDRLREWKASEDELDQTFSSGSDTTHVENTPEL